MQARAQVGLWNNSPGAAGKDPSVLADKPFGEWNKVRVIQIGCRTTVYLNDKLVCRSRNYGKLLGPKKNRSSKRGPIQLQTHGGEIRWRNIYVREIAANEANAMLASKHNDGFENVFNGKDFEGWAGPIDNYKVVDGLLMCKKGKGGTIFTKKEYANFKARLEFKLPPKGNNGLAIRYPGKGNTAYVGMTELQILNYDYPGKLDDRQYHGSAYGMAAAEKGYLRPTGEWNFQEVTVVGSTIKVELNGNIILNADVSKITDFMANSPTSWKRQQEGVVWVRRSQ